MPTPVEKLMLSRVRVMTHSTAMLRSRKNGVVSPLSPPPPKWTVFWEKTEMWQAAEQNPPPPTVLSSRAKAMVRHGSKCGCHCAPACIQTGTPPLIGWVILNMSYNLICLSCKGEMTLVIVKTHYLQGAEVILSVRTIDRQRQAFILYVLEHRDRDLKKTVGTGLIYLSSHLGRWTVQAQTQRKKDLRSHKMVQE